MDAKLKVNFRKVLDGQLRYTSQNLAVNMLLSRLQKKMQSDPGCFDTCVKEMDDFAEKYPNVVKQDYSKILSL